VEAFAEEISTSYAPDSHNSSNKKTYCEARCDTSREIGGFLKIYTDAGVGFQIVGPCRRELQVYHPDFNDSTGSHTQHDDCNDFGSAKA